MNVVVVLMDSLNRHLLAPYGSSEFATPNLQRFAQRSLRFDAHYAGSLPCIPARHDILCGNYDFLWRPWGSIEVWEEAITGPLRQAGVTTMLVSDHPHLFETGGENYHTEFTAWDYLRGHETDPWKTAPDPSWIGAPALPARTVGKESDVSRTWFRSEAEFPGPKTMRAAADWVETFARQESRFFLFIDEFDPHEPFDTPEPYASAYDADWQGPRIIWPPYVDGALRTGTLTEREAAHIRANYGAKLTMIDHWFGKLLDAFDRANLWDDTAIFVTTDHGHYLGEHDAFGKPAVPIYQEMGHLPLLVAWPGVPAGSCEALTTSVDLHATIADVFGCTTKYRQHGRSLRPLIEGRVTSTREHALMGFWGRGVHVVTDRYKYGRAPLERNLPLEVWSNRWSTLPGRHMSRTNAPGATSILLSPPDRRAGLDFMPGATSPVIRQPFAEGDLLPFWARNIRPGEHVLYDLGNDPSETENLRGEPLERAMVDCLRAALEEVDAPRWQFERLALT